MPSKLLQEVDSQIKAQAQAQAQNGRPMSIEAQSRARAFRVLCHHRQYKPRTTPAERTFQDIVEPEDHDIAEMERKAEEFMKAKLAGKFLSCLAPVPMVNTPAIVPAKTESEQLALMERKASALRMKHLAEFSFVKLLMELQRREKEREWHEVIVADTRNGNLMIKAFKRLRQGAAHRIAEQRMAGVSKWAAEVGQVCSESSDEIDDAFIELESSEVPDDSESETEFDCVEEATVSEDKNLSANDSWTSRWFGLRRRAAHRTEMVESTITSILSEVTSYIGSALRSGAVAVGLATSSLGEVSAEDESTSLEEVSVEDESTELTFNTYSTKISAGIRKVSDAAMQAALAIFLDCQARVQQILNESECLTFSSESVKLDLSVVEGFPAVHPDGRLLSGKELLERGT